MVLGWIRPGRVGRRRFLQYASLAFSQARCRFGVVAGASGSHHVHQHEQNELVDAALTKPAPYYVTAAGKKKAAP